MHQQAIIKTLALVKQRRRSIAQKFRVVPNYPGSSGWEATLYLDYYDQAEYVGFCQLSPTPSPADREYSALTKQMSGLRDELALLRRAA